MTTNTVTFYNITERKIFTVLSVGIFSCIFFYLFFIGVMSVSAAQMQRMESEVRTISSSISELEAQYATLGKKITLSYAYSLGFEDSDKTVFAKRKTFAINISNEI